MKLLLLLRGMVLSFPFTAAALCTMPPPHGFRPEGKVGVDGHDQALSSADSKVLKVTMSGANVAFSMASTAA